MTVKELKEILDTFPDNMNIKVTCDRVVRDVNEVSTVVDMDTNIVSVDIIAKDKPKCFDCSNYGWNMPQCKECDYLNGFRYFSSK